MRRGERADSGSCKGTGLDTIGRASLAVRRRRDASAGDSSGLDCYFLGIPVREERPKQPR